MANRKLKQPEFNPARTIRAILTLKEERKAVEQREKKLCEALRSYMEATPVERIDVEIARQAHSALIYARENWSTDREVARQTLSPEVFGSIFTLSTSRCLKVE